MNGKTIYSKKGFKIYKVDNGFIVHNIKKQFTTGHTHINNYNTAKYILNLAFHSSIPQKKTCNYLLESLIRISTDKLYIEQIESLMR